MDLTSKKCIPCEGGIPALKPMEVKKLLEQLGGWKLMSGKKITKEFHPRLGCFDIFDHFIQIGGFPCS